MALAFYLVVAAGIPPVAAATTKRVDSAGGTTASSRPWINEKDVSATSNSSQAVQAAVRSDEVIAGGRSAMGESPRTSMPSARASRRSSGALTATTPAEGAEAMGVRGALETLERVPKRELAADAVADQPTSFSRLAWRPRRLVSQAMAAKRRPSLGGRN